MKNILVTGGAGFIGSQIVKTLSTLNYNVSVIDWIDRAWAIPSVSSNRYLVADFCSWEATNFIKDQNIDAIIHMAAHARVGESVLSPSKYYENNAIKTKALLDTCIASDIDKFIFSSTSSIYGNVSGGSMKPLFEDGSVDPINPYAKSKIMTEAMLSDYKSAYGLDYIALRYFNAAGADPEGTIGYIQDPATHIIPILIKNIISGNKTFIFGDNYLTPDGTCVRDYTHVQDLANAHIKALEYLLGSKKSKDHSIINLGSGETHGLFDLINIAEEVTSSRIDYEITPRRPGDPDCLIADITKAKKILNWKPEYNIYNIMEDAWNWEINKSKYIS